MAPFLSGSLERSTSRSHRTSWRKDAFDDGVIYMSEAANKDDVLEENDAVAIYANCEQVREQVVPASEPHARAQ